MKFLFDLFPVLLFFSVFKWAGSHIGAAQDFASQYLSGLVAGGTVGAGQAPILLATAVAIVATLCQIGYLLARRRKIDTMLWISLAVITVFGGATIYFHDETFIKWKPTVLYWCFATVLLASQVFMKKNLIRAMMEKQMTLPDQLWARVGASWIGFFVFMGLLNLYVAFNYTIDQWVTFKMFGGMGLMFAFILVQSLLLSKYVKESE